jgi:hypothetical protein
MADQCIAWSREVPNTDARDACLILARVWLKAAAQVETIPIDLPIAPTLACNGPPSLDYFKDRPKTSATVRSHR